MPVTELSDDQVHDIVQRWHGRESFLVEMLQDVQHEARYLPQHALSRISHEVGAPMSRIYHLATFFKGFSLVPRGEYIVNVCLGTACHVKGAVRLRDACERHLGIKTGETTPDRRFTLECVRCLGCCGLAAVMTIGDQLHGHVTSVKLPKLFKKYELAETKEEVAA